MDEGYQQLEQFHFQIQQTDCQIYVLVLNEAFKLHQAVCHYHVILLLQLLMDLSTYFFFQFTPCLVPSAQYNLCLAWWLQGYFC